MRSNQFTGKRLELPANRPPIPPALGLTIGILAASTSSILIRFAQVEAPSLVIASYRLGLATLVLMPVLFSRHRAELRAMNRRQLVLTITSGAFLSLHFATWISSLEFTSVASSVVLVQTSPLFVGLLSPFLLREPLSRTVVVGLSLALLGSLIVGISDACVLAQGLQCPPMTEFIQGGAVKGDLLALAGAVTGSAYIMIGRRTRGSVSLIPYITLAYGTAAFVLFIFTLAAGNKLFGYPARTYLWFALLALIPQLLAHSSYNWALRYLPAVLVSLTLLGEPVGSTLLAYLMLDEIPPILRLVGAAFILVGIAIALLQRSSIPTGGSPDEISERIRPTGG